MEQSLEERVSKLEKELKELKKNWNPEGFCENFNILRIIHSLILIKNIIFKLNICFVHVAIFSFVTVSKSIPVQLKFKVKCTITFGITTEFILQCIFHTQDDWGDVSVAVIVVNGVVHRPHQEAFDGYVEGVVSLQSASPLCTTHTTLQLVNFNISHKRRVKLCYWTGRVKFNINRARARFPTLSLRHTIHRNRMIKPSKLKAILVV